MIRIFQRHLKLDYSSQIKQTSTNKIAHGEKENNKTVSEQHVTDKSITRKKRREKITRKKKHFLSTTACTYTQQLFSHIFLLKTFSLSFSCVAVQNVWSRRAVKTSFHQSLAVFHFHSYMDCSVINIESARLITKKCN